MKKILSINFQLLRADAAALESLIAQRTAEEAARLHETMCEIRKEIEEQYHHMVERVEVAAATSTEGRYKGTKGATFEIAQNRWWE
jgi:hypothetical protein